MNTTLFPAGLNDLSFEIYIRANEVYALHNGGTLTYNNFPPALYALIDQIISLRPKAVWALNHLKINDEHERRKKFISCNMANFDFTADVSACMSRFTTEYVPCDFRGGLCSVEGKLCEGIDAPNGKLSLRDLKIMAMIRNGLYDKEISDALCIADDTLKTTKRKIQQRLGVQRKAGIANAAAVLQIS